MKTRRLGAGWRRRAPAARDRALPVRLLAGHGISGDRQPGRLQDRRYAAGHRQGAAGDTLEVAEMSSPEELTFVVGRWLRPIVAVLHVVRRMTFQPISSR